MRRQEIGSRRPTRKQLQQSEVERNCLEPFGNHQLKQSISEPVWNLEPEQKCRTESDQWDRTRLAELRMWLVPPTEAINIGTSMESGTVNKNVERRSRLPEPVDEIGTRSKLTRSSEVTGLVPS